MITVVLDNTKSLDNSDIYQPLLYRSMRHETCFYMKYDENNRTNKIKSIIKYYPEMDYEIVVLLDLSKIGESLLEKVYLINNEIVNDVFSEVKHAVKIRYIVLDFINGNYMKLERELLKNIDVINEKEFEGYISKINKENSKILWTKEINDSDYFSVKSLLIEKVLPFAEVDIITLNKSPNEEKETFYRDIYFKIYGFIDMIAEGVIVEDVANCCYKELPIYKLNIDLNYDAIEETAKRYLLNLENEEKKLSLNTFEKIEQVPVFIDDESEELRNKRLINEINTLRLNLKKPKVTLFRSKKDLKTLEKYIDNVKHEYNKQMGKLKLQYGMECRNARDDLNKDFSDLKTITCERFEVENKIKEETQKNEKQKYKKSKPVINPLDEAQQYDEFLEENKRDLVKVINNRKTAFESIIIQFGLVIVYIILLITLINTMDISKELLSKYSMYSIAVTIGIWLFITLYTFIKYKIIIKKRYKKFVTDFTHLFYMDTEQQRKGIESIQLTRNSIKCEKKIEYLQELLDKANERIEKSNAHKYMIREHKSFAKLVIGNAILDGSVGIQDLNSTYELNINTMPKYKNKTYSFLDYVVYKKYKLSLKNASTSRVIKIENAETYVSYVSIE